MVDRVLLGKGTTARGWTSKYGLWISRPGKDVTTCSDDELIFDTDKGGSADIKGMFQLQTVTATAETTTTTVSASTTANISFTNFNWSFGIIPIMGTAAPTTGINTGQYQGGFTINSLTTSSVNITNLQTTALTVSLSVMPAFSANARF